MCALCVDALLWLFIEICLLNFQSFFIIFFIIILLLFYLVLLLIVHHQHISNHRALSSPYTLDRGLELCVKPSVRNSELDRSHTQTLSLALVNCSTEDKTFRPKKFFLKGSKRDQLHTLMVKTLGSGGNLREAVRIPAGEKDSEWLAVNSMLLLLLLMLRLLLIACLLDHLGASFLTMWLDCLVCVCGIGNHSTASQNSFVAIASARLLQPAQLDVWQHSRALYRGNLPNNERRCRIRVLLG